jgi:hypothetical protein
VAAIVVIGMNRLLGFLRPANTSMGVPVKVGRDKVLLAPKDIVSMVKDIPSLPRPVTHSQEAEGFLMLINHFDPPNDLESKLYSRSMIYGLEIGQREFTHHLESVRG